jgi:hypothetical protein
VNKLLPTCLQCNRELPSDIREPLYQRMIPRITLGDGRWVCAQCVESCARGLANWRARRIKREQRIEAEAERSAAQRAWAAQHTLVAKPPRACTHKLPSRVRFRANRTLTQNSNGGLIVTASAITHRD